MSGKNHPLRCGAAIAALAMSFSGAAPADVAISDKPTENMSCNAGVCTATAQKAVLNVTDLTNMLASGDATVSTGGIARDIDASAALSWTGTSRLTLQADRSLIVKKPVTVAGSGALTLSNGGGKDEGLEFFGKGKVQFWDLSSSLVIGGNSYTLVGDIKTLAADIAANPSGFYALANDYDASADGTYTTSPVGTSLRGVFEGLGNQIISLSIHSAVSGDLVGLFVGTEPQGSIRNLSISDANAYASDAEGISLLAAGNSGQIVRCHASGQISFSIAVGAGGLASENDGLIASSSADVRIKGSGSDMSIGGLADSNHGSIISSYALRSVSLKSRDQSNVGGLAGESSGMIRDILRAIT